MEPNIFHSGVGYLHYARDCEKKSVNKSVNKILL